MYSLSDLNKFAWIIKPIGLFPLSGSLLYDMWILGNAQEGWVCGADPVTCWELLDSFGFSICSIGEKQPNCTSVYKALPCVLADLCVTARQGLLWISIPSQVQHCCWLLSGQARKFSHNFLFMWRYFIHTAFISFLLNYSFKNAVLFFSHLGMALSFSPLLFEVLKSSKAFFLYLW